jgi:succinate-acetate transporter protein
MKDCNSKCCCPCHKMPGILMALVGLSFLLKNAGIVSSDLNNWIWPSLIFIGGLSKICSGFCKCCDSKE